MLVQHARNRSAVQCALQDKGRCNSQGTATRTECVDMKKQHSRTEQTCVDGIAFPLRVWILKFSDVVPVRLELLALPLHVTDSGSTQTVLQKHMYKRF